MKKVVQIGKMGIMYNYLSDEDYGWFYRKGTNHDISISPATRKLIEKGFKVKVSKLEKTDQ